MKSFNRLSKQDRKLHKQARKQRNTPRGKHWAASVLLESDRGVRGDLGGLNWTNKGRIV
jgi:hypothetical protein